MTLTNYKYSLLEDHRRRPLLLQVDDSPLGMFAVLEVSRENHKQYCGNLACLSKIRLCGFGFILVVTILIMASYVLAGERKGLLLTPLPYNFGSTLVSPGASLTFNLSTPMGLAKIKQVVRNIVSKVEFSPRKRPDLEELVHSEPHMFSVIPQKFLPGVKNPCWYEEHSGNITANPYRKNQYARYSKRFRNVFDYLRNAFREHFFKRNGKYFRIRCLPYFYIIGQPKCGTTDLYDRLRLHPEVRFSIFKEPHWWTRKRFGIIRPNEAFHDRYPVEDYLDLFDLGAYQIQDSLTVNASSGPKQHNIIIGEASASTMWDNNAWTFFHDNTATNRDEPPFLIQDYVHALQPDARFIAILRDPVERLYSDYLYFGITNKSAEDFHEKVTESLQLFEGCLQEFSIRSCVYNSTLNSAMPVRMQVGLYIVYILDWLTVFSREQLLILRLEDHASNRKFTMHKVFSFLKLGPLTEQKEAEITKSPASNTRRLADKNLGPMLPLTREILRDFYLPFNKKLAKVLRDGAFLWESRSKAV
ncbi:carbohydrate sulfotransferase 15 isoform X1 [Denticeps clupeoides]|uniref:Sulfotransferase n=1 Tax=Denticeps clupeoides TaxID=299321 RepID=A0AAY4A5H2_9TELE|nr:carbohydrate sulfotransferase 15 isoform X1 [Denticeps clupeoides]XP_028826524.1 carbohydrate sulfotransferase 15 isoform X1 [Denticeps clupeoides]XP_028826526.1 carbohydrate sulfotransferase 15 isoform X1 [Denticeps clupeoides]XP_028826527.1 carbohydrate sulfotransferase 15 isoform X1 [Denticeps clupeoides]